MSCSRRSVVVLARGGRTADTVEHAGHAVTTLADLTKINTGTRRARVVTRCPQCRHQGQATPRRRKYKVALDERERQRERTTTTGRRVFMFSRALSFVEYATVAATPYPERS